MKYTAKKAIISEITFAMEYLVFSLMLELRLLTIIHTKAFCNKMLAMLVERKTVKVFLLVEALKTDLFTRI